MTVGTVKEIKKHEYRVGLTPDNVKEYRAHSHTVLVESGAGEGSSFSDAEYAAAGAEIAASASDVWSRADMVVKVKEPLEPEYDLMQRGQIVYTYFHLAADKPLTETLMKKEVTAVAYETVRGESGGLPLLTPMSEVAGRLSIQAGAKCLEKPMGGRGVLLPGVPGTKRCKVVILGGGVVGLNACKLAVGFGADVTILDVNADRLRQLDDMFGARIQTLYSTPSNIESELLTADLVIGAVLIPGGATPKLVRREYLGHMQPGSVIVDVAVDQGGCCQTTRATYHDNPTYVVDGVIHYCVGNMPGAVPRTSTMALTNATLSYGLQLADHGWREACLRIPGLRPGINTALGKLVFDKVAECHGLPYTPLAELLK